MCDYCKNIILTDHFYSPKTYFNCLSYIKTLLKTDEFVLLKADCPIDNVKDENGGWYDDIIEHQIQCKKCKKHSHVYVTHITETEVLSNTIKQPIRLHIGCCFFYQ